MKIILVVVTSINGKITDGGKGDINSWTSKEDQDFFKAIMKENNLVLMGAKTYEVAKANMKLTSQKLRVVLTKNPKKYVSIAGQLEFTDESPAKLVSRLQRKYKKMLLLGGSHIFSAFLKTKLVNELFLTMEPKIFGLGKPLVLEENLNVSLKLVDFKKLNSAGTLLLHYML